MAITKPAIAAVWMCALTTRVFTAAAGVNGPRRDVTDIDGQGAR